MSLAKRTVNDLIRIAAAGGGLVLEGAHLSPNDLIRIAAAARTKDARILITGVATKSTDDLVRIGAAGNGCVQFEG